MHYYCLYTNLKAKASDIAPLRRKIAVHLGKFNDQWHNHDLENGQYIHRYPLIQYKIIKNCFSILFIEPTEEQLWAFLRLLPLRLASGKTLDFWQIEKFPLRLHIAKPQRYQCNNFLPFDSERFTTFQQLCDHLSISASNATISDPTLLRFLEEILKGQLIKQSQALGFANIEKELKLSITTKQISHSLVKLHKTKWSKIGRLALRTNLHWPEHLGVGKGSAIGFGMLRKM